MASLQQAATAASTAANKHVQYREIVEDAMSLTSELAQSLDRAHRSPLQGDVHHDLVERALSLAEGGTKLNLQAAALAEVLNALSAQLQAAAASTPADADPNETEIQDYSALLLEMVKNSMAEKATGTPDSLQGSDHYKAVLKKLRTPQRAAGEDEEELEVMEGSETATHKCPISGSLLKNPYKSKTCGHTFSKDAIMNHLRVERHKSKIMCPIPGCSHPISQQDLIVDKEMARELQVQAQVESQTQAQAAEQDAEDVDDDEEDEGLLTHL